MPTRKITISECAQAYRHLDDIDPDDCPDGTLEAIIWDRKELEPHANNHQRSLQQIIRPYVVQENGQMKEVEEGEEVTPMEARLGVHLDFEEEDDREKVADELNNLGNEKVEVTVATVPYEDLREIANGRIEDLRFMLDIDV